ncbi:hypothetical protein HY448_02125 [Candidatus Pacearchaeota archaeon]|nr:hypothetical protein [Candidatus Pacearchaeota archaeon]
MADGTNNGLYESLTEGRHLNDTHRGIIRKVLGTKGGGLVLFTPLGRKGLSNGSPLLGIFDKYFIEGHNYRTAIKLNVAFNGPLYRLGNVTLLDNVELPIFTEKKGSQYGPFKHRGAVQRMGSFFGGCKEISQNLENDYKGKYKTHAEIISGINETDLTPERLRQLLPGKIVY